MKHPFLCLLIIISCSSTAQNNRIIAVRPFEKPVVGLHKKSLRVDGNTLTYRFTTTRIAASNPVLLRGVNYHGAWAYDVYDKNATAFRIKEITKTGANTVRIVWDGAEAYQRDAAALDSMMSWCVQNNMIPVPELHNTVNTYFTCGDLTPQLINEAVLYWTKPSIMAVLKKYSNVMILNIANETGAWNGADDNTLTQKVINAYTPAIRALRDAGYTCPLMIDAPYCGQNGERLANAAQTLLQADSYKNLIFSVHAYWLGQSATNNYTTRLTNIKNLMGNACWVIGEFSQAQDCSNNASTNDYKAIMKFCNDNKIGYYAWIWGGWGLYDNNGNACPEINGYNRVSMTDRSGQFSKLKDWGLDVANDIKATSKQIIMPRL